MDNIKVYVSGNEKVEAIMNKNSDEIKNDVLAIEIINASVPNSKEWNINGEKVSLGVEKI